MKRPAFRLDRRLAPPRAVRRVALAQLDFAAAGLSRGGARAVHEARKTCKRLRALLRLLRPQLGAAYRVENALLRDAGRALSQHRDAAVRAQTARALATRDRVLRPLARLLRAASPRGDAGALTEARRLLAAQRARVVPWPVEGASLGSLMAGLLHGYRGARASYRRARRAPTAAALHEWRKQVKYHGYQGELLATLWPALARRARDLDRLGEQLGWHHDLELLAQTLRGDDAALRNSALVPRARHAIAAAQARAAQRSLALGARLFADKPLAWLGAR